MYSFIIYFPIMSFIMGTPLPLPSIFTPSPELMALLNLFSLLVTLVGALVGIAFYLERRTNLKFESQNKQIERIEEMVGEAVIATNEHIKIVRQDMKDMEKRICEGMDSRNKTVEKNIEERVIAAKLLEDERMANIHHRLGKLEGGFNIGGNSSRRNR